MSSTASDPLRRFLLLLFALFTVATTFSIALAQTALGLSLAMFIVICIRDRHQPFVSHFRWLWWLIAAYVCWLALSSMIGPKPLQSIVNVKDEWLFLIIPITLLLASDERSRWQLVTAFAVAVGIISLYAIVQAATGVAWFKVVDGKLTSVPILDVQGNFGNCMTFGNFTVTAGSFVLGIGLLIEKGNGRRPWLFTTAGLLAIVATVLTLRRGAIGAAIVTLMLFALLLQSRKRWLLVGLSAITVTIIIAAPGLSWRFGEKALKDLNTTNPGSRVYIWERSFDMVKKHPLFGVGLGNFYDEYVARLPLDIPQSRKLNHAHNDFIHVAAIAGIPAALFFAGIWLAMVHFLWHGSRNVGGLPRDRALCLAALLGSVAFLVTSMIEATFADEEVRQMLMFVWGIGLVSWYKYSNRPAQSA